jgi:tetratricopeptide (TPR) repeat protein
VPGFALAHAALADTKESLRDSSGALEHAQRAFELSGELPRVDRLRIEATLRTLRNDRGRAADLLRMLVELQPDELGHGLKLVHVLGSVGRTEDAERALGELRARPGAQEDARVDLAEAHLARLRWSYDRADAAARRAIDRAGAQGWRALEAEARQMRGMSLQAAGKPTEAIAELARARTMFHEVGLLQLELTTLRSLATAHADAADFDGSEALSIELVALERRLGESSARSLLHRVGVLLRRSRPGDLEEIAVAVAAIEERHADDRYVVALARVYLSQARLEQGRTSDAHALAVSARRSFEQLGNTRMRAFARVVAADALLVQGDPRGARRELEEARQEREGLGLAVPTAAADALIASIDLYRGEITPAVARARRAGDAVAGETTLDTALAIRGVLVRALLAAQAPAEAAAVLERMLPLCGKTPEVADRIVCAEAQARVDAQARRVPAAVKRLEAAARSARASGLLRSTLELELLAGAIEAASGRGGARIARARAEATRSGLEGLALPSIRRLP